VRGEQTLNFRTPIRLPKPANIPKENRDRTINHKHQDWLRFKLREYKRSLKLAEDIQKLQDQDNNMEDEAPADNTGREAAKTVEAERAGAAVGRSFHQKHQMLVSRRNMGNIRPR